jgi:hypothetical protein
MEISREDFKKLQEMAGVVVEKEEEFLEDFRATLAVIDPLNSWETQLVHADSVPVRRGQGESAAMDENWLDESQHEMLGESLRVSKKLTQEE